MSLTKTKHEFTVGTHRVELAGKATAGYPQWTMTLDGREVAAAKKAGEFELRADVDGAPLVARVKQGHFGGYTIDVTRNGEHVRSEKGYLFSIWGLVLFS